MLPFDAEMGKNQKAIKVLQRLFDAGYVTEKEIVNMTMDEMLALPGVNVADLFIISELQKSIKANAEQIIQNEKDGHQTFIYKLLLARTGINPKKNSAIGELAKNIEIAIEQEKKINEDIHQCKGQITCNIGRIIDEIRKDDGK